jgi:hypothetical protein
MKRMTVTSLGPGGARRCADDTPTHLRLDCGAPNGDVRGLGTKKAPAEAGALPIDEWLD